MKSVTKGLPPTSFEDWKASANADWEPTYPVLRDPQKRDLHTALLAEQGGVCCYCGRSVGLNDSHIEHFRPQRGKYSHLQLSYDNLFASCFRELDPGMPLHCGHAKGNKFDEEQHISPLDITCEERFIYTQLGDVVPLDPLDSPAKYMMNLLALNTPSLRNAREDAVSRVFDADFLVTVSSDELRLLRDAYRSRDGEGRLLDFGHVVARYAEQRLNDAPDLPPAPAAI
ncbi:MULTISPECIES: retron system putative HNH endonuclease [Paraburkholderia]|uniref:retron system putative HNH endonuclease n=1 Tax=Paraburkholderia TaxID=1822464 RepID=UPI00224CD312|nr:MULTISPECIES: retron system putative HNH endonuclease [Paraburkholderia]MCX4165326.1 TIGR02646 family protein [Paraburkholderia megapolitana]MDN7160818.1 TIGR02646 family protein [Paraburkholderia sp. CHISQ3]MDQ6497865.1 TIGR02646 family protein [Paraburkholderia megapolitana]